MTKAWGLMVEFFTAKGVKGINLSQLQEEERNWISFTVSKINQTPQMKNTIMHQNWKIRKTKEEFQAWVNTLNKACLFFDSASKNNPGKAGTVGKRDLGSKKCSIFILSLLCICLR